MDNKLLIEQIFEIITEYNSLKARSQYDDLSDMDDNIIIKLVTKSKAVVVRIVGLNSEYYKEIEKNLNMSHLFIGEKLGYVIGSLEALMDDLENDYLKTYSELIHSEIFSDYIESSNYLLEKGYKDSSAVIVGSTLESHLRKLCEKFNIETYIVKDNEKQVPKKADLINSELSKENIYSKSYQKQITAWLDIRNNAAHGHYDSYSIQEVKLMIQGIQNFVLNYPA